MRYRLCMIANSQNGLIYRKFSVFWSGFFNKTIKTIFGMDFLEFLEF